MNDSLKHLVLKLHSLSEKQREWVFSNLSIAEKEKVYKLLNELSNIKHSTNRNVLIQSINKIIEPGQQSQATTDDKEKLILQKIIKKLDKAESTKLSNVLEHEDAWLVALILNHRSWSWSKDIELSLSYDKIKIINQLRDMHGVSIDQDVILIILNILLMAVESEASDNILMIEKKAIDYDDFNNFIGSQDQDSNKNWWRELWHS